jgi:hypothetical protein
MGYPTNLVDEMAKGPDIEETQVFSCANNRLFQSYSVDKFVKNM